MGKKAALLINLGSPDSTEVKDVKEYLREFLTDERVIDQAFVRKVIVPLIILNTRPKKSAEAYSSIWTDEGSPLIVTTEHQREKMEERSSVPVYMAMRYANPSIPDVLQKMAEDGIDSVFVIPLYPQYAMSSYETVVVKVTDSIRAAGLKLDVEFLQPFYNDKDYLDILANSMRPAVEKGMDRLLFSFHGIPERHLCLSDPSHAHCMVTPNCCDKPNPAHHTCYRHQCFYVVKEVAARLHLKPEQYFVSFQSRLGRDPWLRPYTDQTLEDWAKEGVKSVKVACPAFTTDCLETLEEIDEEGREIFLENGGESFEMIPCLNEDPRWIQWLVNKVEHWATASELAGKKH